MCMNSAANNTSHPDFITELSAQQVAWCAAKGIEIDAGDHYGFFFGKNDMWVEPIAATDDRVYLMENDYSEHGDGAQRVETYPRLRDALVALLAMA